MKAIATYLFLCVCCITTLSSSAQRLHDWVVLGDQAMETGDPGGALYYYQNAMDIDSSQGTLNYKYADALRLNHNYMQAAYHYNKVYRRERGKIFPLGGYWLARMQKQAGSYADAKITWRRVRDQFRSDTTSYYYRKAIQEIRSIDKATELLADTQITILNTPHIPINTTASEFAGIYLADGSIVFSSLRGLANEKNEVVDPQSYTIKMYKADSTETVSISTAGFTGYHTGNLVLVPGTDTVYFSVCSSKAICSIYRGLLRQNTIVGATLIPTLTGDSLFSYTQPAPAVVNGQSGLFVVANQEAGSEFSDIYWCETSDNGTVSPPQPIGLPVNSPGNELTPFYDSENNHLYFSSDWHYGLGGLDIFRSEFGQGVPGRPENLGLDFNSSANDLYFWLDVQSGKGLLSSNRGTEPCCSDVYTFEAATLQKDSLPEITSLEDLNRYLPVTLYFHNDEPDPRSTDTTTNVSYLDAYYSYTDMLPKYEQEYSKGLPEEEKLAAEEEMDRFFLTEVDQGVEDLKLFARLLLRELQQGARVEMTVQAFASPLAKSDYNLRLSVRRIQSLLNYFHSFENGAFEPFLSGGDNAQLVINKVPFGEYSSATTITDNPNENNAIYGLAAARERRIQIVEIGHSSESEVAKLSVDNPVKIINSPGVVTFTMKNNGNLSLQIDSLAGTGVFNYSLSATTVPPGAASVFTVPFPSVPTTRTLYEFTVYSNALGGPRKLSVIFEPNTIPNRE